jgi:hypothetical protein
MRSDAFFRILAGPVGSGKTVACIVEILRRAVEQTPAPDGYRYTRWAVVRQTLKQLKDTVLKDAKDWLGGIGEWKVSENTFYLNFDDVRSELIFIPLENAEDQARLLSMQLTGAWLSETIEMDLSVVKPISGRLGRYPSGNRGQPTWFGMFADTNMPTEMTPWHTFMENLPSDAQKFVQPSGLAPEAENLNHLLQTERTAKLPLNHPERLAQGRRYYERFIEMYGADSDWVKRYVYAEYGDDPSGMAVFRQSFKSAFHVVDDTLLIPGYPILLAQDWGRNPWTLICQIDHRGRLIIHQEVPATNIGLEKHVNESLKPILFSDKFLGYRVAVVGDPAGVAKSSVSEESNFDAMKRLGFPCFPAPTNDIDPRLRAVEAMLSRQSDGGPALMFSRSGCPKLIRAMGGGYRFARTKAGTLRPIPEKDEHSHPADCLQYACLIANGGMMEVISERIRPRQRRSVNRMSPAAWT